MGLCLAKKANLIEASKMRVRKAPRRVLKRAKIRVVALGFRRKEHGHHPKRLL